MTEIDFEHPIYYTDHLGEEYRFHYFVDVRGNRHLSITRYRKKILQQGFALPVIDGQVQWEAYQRRNDCEGLMSRSARQFASKLEKLKAFL